MGRLRDYIYRKRLWANLGFTDGGYAAMIGNEKFLDQHVKERESRAHDPATCRIPKCCAICLGAFPDDGGDDDD